MAPYFSLAVMALLIGGTSAQCQLQLVGGIGPNSGFLQVFVGEWRYMSLSSEVTPDGVNGLCQEMGFEGASNATMVPIDNVSNGTLDVAQCDSTQGLAAGMGCELGQTNGTEDLLFMDCIQADNANGTVRLMSSNTTGDTTEGVLQTSVNGRWYLVDTILLPSQRDANIVCRLIGAGDATDVRTEVSVSVGTVVVPETGCIDGSAEASLDCITNGSIVDPLANQTAVSMGTDDNNTICVVSVVSAVFITCGNRDVGGPTITRVRSGLPLTFTLIIIITSIAIVVVVIVASLMYMFVCLFCCKRKSSIWKRAKSLRSRNASYSFVWRQAAGRNAGDDNNGTPAETNNNTEYTQWKDDDNVSIKSGSMRMYTESGTFTATTFGRQVHGMDLQQQNAA